MAVEWPRWKHAVVRNWQHLHRFGECAVGHLRRGAHGGQCRSCQPAPLPSQRGTRSLGILAAFIWHSVSDERKLHMPQSSFGPAAAKPAAVPVSELVALPPADPASVAARRLALTLSSVRFMRTSSAAICCR